MPTHIALLRGINVSGQKIIKMEALRKLMVLAGFENVSTYIQSGNVIFDSPQTSKKVLSEQITKMILAHYGFDVSVIMINPQDLEKAIAENPFLANEADLKQLYVTFLSENPTAENIAKFRTFDVGRDLAEFADHIIYLKYADSAAHTKLSNALLENKLKVRATTRNWNTTLKLLALLEARL